MLKLKAVDSTVEDTDLPLDLCQYEICGTHHPSIRELFELFPRRTQFTEGIDYTTV